MLGFEDKNIWSHVPPLLDLIALGTDIT